MTDQQDSINAYFNGGPMNGRIAKFPRSNVAPDFIFRINDICNYRMLNGPVLDAIQQGAQSDHLAVTLEFVEDSR